MVCRSLGLAPCLAVCGRSHARCDEHSGSRHAVISHSSPSLLPNPRYYKCRIESRTFSSFLCCFSILPITDTHLLIP